MEFPTPDEAEARQKLYQEDPEHFIAPRMRMLKEEFEQAISAYPVAKYFQLRIPVIQDGAPREIIHELLARLRTAGWKAGLTNSFEGQVIGIRRPPVEDGYFVTGGGDE